MDGSVANRRLGSPRSGIAERIWVAARAEFSRRGYHGARVQGIARGASCNVALMYRHWTSKRALYQDVLRSVWLGAIGEIVRLLETRPPGQGAVVSACLDAMLSDATGAQILVREYLDGAPFLSELVEVEPALLEPVRRAASALAPAAGGGDGVDPMLAVVTMGGIAALVASACESDHPFVGVRAAPDAWRRHVLGVLVNGLGTARAPEEAGANGSALR